jgi:hypothetical protein
MRRKQQILPQPGVESRNGSLQPQFFWPFPGFTIDNVLRKRYTLAASAN